MELVYLWVKDYKNIHKQGFNFSPRFECSFDGEELTICDKKGELAPKCQNNDYYIENFFGDNINVTAIVGKNGSGKSSVLELISFIIASKECIIVFMLLIFSEKNGFTLYLNHIKPRENFVTKTINIQEQKKNNDIFGIFYSNNFTNGSFDNETGWFSTVLKPNLDANEFEENTFYLKGRTNENLLTQSIFNLFVNSPKYLSELKVFSYSDGKGFFGSGQLKSLISHAKTILIAMFLERNKKNIPFNISGEIAIHINENRYKKNMNMLDSIREYIKSHHCDAIISLLKAGTFTNDFYIVNFDIFHRIVEIYLDYISTSNGAIDFLQFEFSSLSSGEENYILMLALLELGIRAHLHKDVKNSNIVLLLDELEHTFHPEWQKNTISYLLSFLNSIIDKNEIKFHILVTSHSPFLISDLSKNNIIFLDKYKEEDNDVKYKQQKIGNCKVVDGLKQTFGANIHTLLSDSFFMEDGLMGEFAKNKIRIIKVAHRYILHKHKRKTLFTQSCKRSRRLLIKRLPKFWQIQKIIGEPFLQKIVQNQLEEIELILLGKDEAIDNEIARLQALKKSSKNA